MKYKVHGNKILLEDESGREEALICGGLGKDGIINYFVYDTLYQSGFDVIYRLKQ